MNSKGKIASVTAAVALGLLCSVSLYAKFAEQSTKASKSSGGILQQQLDLLKSLHLFGKGTHVARRYELLSLQAAQEFEQKHFEKAAIIYYTIVENPEFADVINMQEMEFFLLSSLYHNHDDYAALGYMDKALKRGTKNPHFVEVFRILVDTLNRVRDWDEIEPVLKTLQAQRDSLPEVIREEANYLFGRMAFFRNDYAQAKPIFASISSLSRFHSRALYHLGVIAAKEGNLPQADKIFKKAYSISQTNNDFRISEMEEGQAEVNRQKARFQELCLLAIARVEYALDQDPDFSKIPAASPYYPIALFESGWAAFHQKEYINALRIVENYFVRFPQHELAPEAILLNANSNMEAGRLILASKEFKRFVDRYESVLPVLKYIYQNRDASQAYKDFNQQKEIQARPELYAWVYQETKLQNIRKFLDTISYEEKNVAHNREHWSSVNQLVSDGDKKILFPTQSNIKIHGDLAKPASTVSKKNERLHEFEQIEAQLKTRLSILEEGSKKVQNAKGRKSEIDREIQEERQRLAKLQDSLKTMRQRILTESDNTLTAKKEVSQPTRNGPRDFQNLITKEADLLPLIQSDLENRRDAFITLSAKIVQQHIRMMTEDLESLVKKAYLGEIEAAFLEGEKANGDVAASRTRVVQLINNFLAKYPRAPEVPDHLFRLAEVSYDQSKQQYFSAQEQFDLQYARFTKGEIKTEPKEPHPDYSNSIKICQRILNDFPKYKSKDKVLYVLGYYYDEQVQKQKSIATFKQLVEEYPKSEYAIEGHMRLAENYFDLRELKQAIQAYQVVMQYPNSVFYELAIYKIAWSNYRMADYKGAIQYFTKLIGLKKETATELRGTGLEEEFQRRLQDLHNESLKYLALSYSEEGGPNAVIANFKLNGLSKYTVKVLGLLSDIYFEELRYTESIDATRAYLTYSPFEADGPKYQERIIKAYDAMGDSAAAFRERQKMAEMFGPWSEWTQKNRKNKKAISDAVTLVKASLIYSATLYHERAQKASSNNPGTKSEPLNQEAIKSYKLAIEAYKKFIWAFSESPEAYEMRFNYAECLFTIGDFETAGYQYQMVAQKNLKDGKFLKDAAFSAILSYEALLKGTGVNFESEVEKMKQVTAPKQVLDPSEISIKPKDLSETQKNLVAAYDNYTTWLPKENKVPEVMFKAALLHFQTENYGEAVKRFVHFNERFPKHSLSASALNYVLIANTTTQNWDQVELWARKISKDPILQSKFQQKELNALLGVSILYQAELFKKKGDLKDASAKYLTIHSELADNPVAAQGMFNAASIYEKQGKRILAIDTLKSMVKKYPQSDLAPLALLQVSKAYESDLQFDLAASTSEQLARAYPKSEYASDALFNSALFLENLGDNRRAGENYLSYAKTYPQKPDAADIHFLSAKAFERSGDLDKGLSLFKEHISQYNPSVDRKIECYTHAGEIYEAQKQHELAQEEFQKAFQTYKKNKKAVSETGRYFAGKSQFLRAEAAFAKFNSVKIQGNSKKLGRKLEKKAGLLEEANNLYLESIEVGHPEWAVASLYKMGRGYQAFSEAIFDAPKPEGMKGKELEKYQEDLKETAFPIEDKAIEAFEKAVKNAHKVNDYSIWTQRALNQLQAYRPSAHPPMYEILPQIQTVGAPGAQGGSDEI